MNMSSDVAASFPKSMWLIAVVLFSSPLLLNTASAQFGTSFPGQTTCRGTTLRGRGEIGALQDGELTIFQYSAATRASVAP